MQANGRPRWPAKATASTILLKIPEAARRLGCSPQSVYRLIAAGELRVVDSGMTGSRASKSRVRSDDIDAWIDARTRTAGKPSSPAA